MTSLSTPIIIHRKGRTISRRWTNSCINTNSCQSTCSTRMKGSRRKWRVHQSTERHATDVETCGKQFINAPPVPVRPVKILLLATFIVRCADIYCRPCTAKMEEEHGTNVFQGGVFSFCILSMSMVWIYGIQSGCPVVRDLPPSWNLTHTSFQCKGLCCCGEKTIACTNKFHCYKKVIIPRLIVEIFPLKINC